MEKNSAITLRKHKTGQAPEGNDALQLSDLYKLLQSVEKRLSERLLAIEKSLMERLQLAETSLDHAYNTISDLTSDLKGVEKELTEMRENTRKSETSLSWSTFRIFRGDPRANWTCDTLISYQFLAMF